MNARKLCVLVAEHQYFIAMEAERLLQEILGCDVEICRRDEVALELASKHFDVVLLDAPDTLEECEGEGLGFSASGRTLIFLCADSALAENIHNRLGYTVLEKPFSEHSVRHALQTAIGPLE